MSGDPPPVLEARGLRFGYRRGEELLKGVDLALAAGEVAFLWGLNGAGKTTLGKLLAGLYKPTGGEIKKTAGAQVGMVLADYGGLLLGATPGEDVRLGPAAQKLPEAEVAARTAAALALVGMAGKEDVSCDELSLGERKRVALAAAFALAPAALVLDEPFAFLDDEQAAAVWGCVAGMAARGTACLIMSGRRAHGERCGRRHTLAGGIVTPW